MTLTDWLAYALTDIERRNLQQLRPVLEGLARATASLRQASWNADASGQALSAPGSPDTDVS